MKLVGLQTALSSDSAGSAFSVGGPRSGDTKLSFRVCQEHVFGTGTFGKEWKWVHLRHVAFGRNALAGVGGGLG